MSDKKPDLAFVVPAYNVEAYLAETIVSCLTQSHKNIEIIVVDDGSTDATPDIIKFYKDRDPRVKGLRVPNGGRGAARNIGCQAADAPLLAMLDADDRSDKGRARATIDLHAENPMAYLYGGASLISVFGAELAHFIPEALVIEKVLASPRKENGIVHSTAAFPRDLWGQFKFDEDEYQAIGLDDWHQQTRMALAGVKFVYTPKILSGYTQVATGISRTRDERQVLAMKEKFLSGVGAYAQVA